MSVLKAWSAEPIEIISALYVMEIEKKFMHSDGKTTDTPTLHSAFISHRRPIHIQINSRPTTDSVSLLSFLILQVL